MNPLPSSLWRQFAVVLLPALLLLAAGCSKPPPGPAPVQQITITVASTPPGASVYIDETERAFITPFQVKADALGHFLEFRFADYRTTWRRVPPGKDDVKLDVTLEPITAAIFLESEPVNAAVDFDGLQIGRTPVFVPDAKLGPHKIELQLPGHAIKELRFDVKSQRPEKLSVAMVSVLGSVKVRSQPGGAEIFLDGVSRGRTPPDGMEPLVIPDVKEGEHQIVARKPGYNDLRHDFQLMPKEPKFITLPGMVELPGQVEVTTDPTGAKVFVNGEWRGKSPYLLKDQKAGVIMVRVELEGYDAVSQEVTVSPGITKKVGINLAANLGTLTFSTNPPGCFVYLDGKMQPKKTERAAASSLESDPYTVENIPEGNHTLRLEHPLREPANARFLLQKGERKNLGRIELAEKWIPTHELKLKNAAPVQGKLINTKHDKSIEWAPDKTTKVVYRADEYEYVKELK